MSGVDPQMLDEMVDFYNQKMMNGQSNGRSTIATDPSHNTPLSTFTMNTGFESMDRTPPQLTRNNFNNQLSTEAATLPYNIHSNNDNAYINALFDDPFRYHLNDTVLSGGSARQQFSMSADFQHDQTRTERVHKPDTLRFPDNTNFSELENNEEHSMRYPDVKPYLEVVSGKNFNLPNADMVIKQSEQVNHLIKQGKLKNLYGYINYPYNYIEPPWHFDNNDEQSGMVNHNPPPAAININDLEYTDTDMSFADTLPPSVPHTMVHSERHEWAPLPKLLYDHFVPLVPTRRLVFRRDMNARDFAFATEKPRLYSNSSEYPNYNTEPSTEIPSSLGNILHDIDASANQLPEVEEMTYRC
ncbi:unnamed protein product [Didymodactylos carnosus]|uniref:Uncharacterized protein n=1 Tax=Didymodactylos carnosus TaxID=1234261 RepID=A0A813Y639_9BILA|nr:unnamed protein product [Didymodactylos carnosus]CAF1182462.1 unnamed protein product [Didymodactylos carnosus]CAF3663661.1 unnamed protein product [Didymodactylos carnosus]CAF3993705.1 unnamed protein product [Didymodactylos carnosus]